MPARQLAGLLVLAFITSAWAAEPAQLSVRDATRWALAENPELAVARQKRALAEAGIVLARIYPHNPVLNLTPRGATGPEDTVTHPFTIDTALTLEIETHGQRPLRQRAAREAVSRVEWEIAAQELAVAGKTVRAFNAVIYRQEKLRLQNEYVRLAQRALEEIRLLREKKKEKLAAGEQVLLQFEIQDAKAQLVTAQGPLVAAEQELRHLLSCPSLPPVVGSLAITKRDWSVDALQAQAQTLRPDYQAKQLALVEANTALGLERASRFGNPTVGPSFSTNETGIYFIGASFQFSLPVCNRKQGEILLRQAELQKSELELRQNEIQINHEIVSALARLAQIQELIQLLQDNYLPALRSRSEELQKLYNQEDPGVDAQQVLELRRRLLKVQESYLDALYEHGQIEVDLALAVGDLELAFDPE